ncbi:MAG: 16S rRNA (guanine(527)-N(7))-methyltransferase RsmG [Rickettsiales bacterium]|jgi:16S rRNA (guanine527-N7)-methyltransferase|nr:16S rRNA (guanine(527)-N(7))-methyltransferase RsmG [Rickettsiales bacterium]
MTAEQKFTAFERMLSDWGRRMNLVSKGSLSNIRERHINDSLQLAAHIPKDKTVIDLGSGAGFPAAVLAILGYKVIAIESIGKKCRFLEALKSELNLPNLTIINDRVENALPRIAGKGFRAENYIFTARAFAPLIRILDLTQKLDIPYVLLKGKSAPDEIALALGKYNFGAEMIQSATGDGFIVKLTINRLCAAKRKNTLPHMRTIVS